MAHTNIKSQLTVKTLPIYVFIFSLFSSFVFAVPISLFLLIPEIILEAYLLKYFGIIDKNTTRIRSENILKTLVVGSVLVFSIPNFLFCWFILFAVILGLVSFYVFVSISYRGCISEYCTKEELSDRQKDDYIFEPTFKLMDHLFLFLFNICKKDEILV